MLDFSITIAKKVDKYLFFGYSESDVGWRINGWWEVQEIESPIDALAKSIERAARSSQKLPPIECTYAEFMKPVFKALEVRSMKQYVSELLQISVGVNEDNSFYIYPYMKKGIRGAFLALCEEDITVPLSEGYLGIAENMDKAFKRAR